MKIKEMRALTIVQPGAAMLMDEGAIAEPRTWNTHRRGYISIHASGSYKADRFANTDYDPDELDYGAVIGFAKIDEVEGEPGDYHLCLTGVMKLKEPVEVKGMMNLWRLEGRELQKCLSQLTPAQIKRIESTME